MNSHSLSLLAALGLAPLAALAAPKVTTSAGATPAAIGASGVNNATGIGLAEIYEVP